MDWDKLIDVVLTGEEYPPERWHVIPCGVSDYGPSYWGEPITEESPDLPDGPKFPDRYYHTRTAVVKDDLMVRLAWGCSIDENFQAPWLKTVFDRGSASHEWVDAFYNEGLVFRTAYLLADNRRVIVPTATGELPLSIPKAQASFLKLLNGLSWGHRGVERFERFVATEGVSFSSETWPEQ